MEKSLHSSTTTMGKSKQSQAPRGRRAETFAGFAAAAMEESKQADPQDSTFFGELLRHNLGEGPGERG